MEETKKIYIGNISFNATEDDIKKMLDEKGLSATQVNIITDRYSGKSKGFGFAEFDTEEKAQQAIDALNGQDLNGRSLNVSKAKKPKPRGNGFGGGGGGGYRGRDNYRDGGFGRGGRY